MVDNNQISKDTTVTLDIGGMHCGSCIGRVEAALKTLPETLGVAVNLATETARVTTSQPVNLEKLVAAVEKAGYEASLHRSNEDHLSRSAAKRKALRHEFRQVMVGALFTAPLVVPMFFMPLGWGEQIVLPGVWQLLLASPVQFWIGLSFYRGAFAALKKFHTNMDVLVALGTSAAFGLSLHELISGGSELYFESSAVIITLVKLGKYFESRAKLQTTDALSNLQQLKPETARVKTADGLQIRSISQLKLGDIVVVHAGESIAADGEVIEGTAAVNQAMVTGESLPVTREPGDPVIGGTINTDGTLEIEVKAIGSTSMLARIIRAVERAQGKKAPIERLVDKVSSIFVPAIIGLAVLTFLGWFFWLQRWV